MTEEEKINEHNKKMEALQNAILQEYENVAYQKLEYDLCGYLVGRFLTCVNNIFLTISPNAKPGQLLHSNKSITNLVVQVWKRKIYFQVFHHDVKMNEIKESALYAFWILKYQPFFISGIPDMTNTLNARIALYLLFRGVASYVEGMNEREEKEKKKNPSHTIVRYYSSFEKNEDIIGKLMYSFHNRDWSKEALMDLGESFVIKF